MVEGHSVHRVATLHRNKLVGKIFRASSPNGRFTNGAKAINGKKFLQIEAVGKNLFAFFGNNTDTTIVVVHVHFGMAGAGAVYDNQDEEIPSPTKTTRLRLTNDEYTADLSAMTCTFGGYDDLYTSKKSKLGQDPLRDDADPELLWTKVRSSNKSIGALIMDQSYFCGPGNIYRAEILFKAGVHPNTCGKDLTRSQFDTIWHHTVDLLRRGYQTGSILTVDPDEALQQPNLRRYIYNTSHCPRCQTRIQTWTINSRTCYACPTCQPKNEETTSSSTPCTPFHSHCARESVATRLATPERLTVAEIKKELLVGWNVVPSSNLRKADLVQLLLQQQQTKTPAKNKIVKMEAAVVSPSHFVSSEEAAAEKAAAKESLAVEHIAELGPDQARRARGEVKNKRRSSKNDGDTRRKSPRL